MLDDLMYLIGDAVEWTFEKVVALPGAVLETSKNVSVKVKKAAIDVSHKIDQLLDE